MRLPEQTETELDGFDPKDEDSWNFGPLSRPESIKLLEKDHTNGVFLVRESNLYKGSFVLSARQGDLISHFMITRSEVQGVVEYTIGDRKFQDVPSLLQFYKTHCLDNSTLTHPLKRDSV